MGTGRFGNRTRREVLAAAAAGGATALGAGLVGVRGVAAQRGAISGGGVAGGGAARADEGEAEAQFSLFASRLTLAEGDEPTFFGQVRWLDAEEGVLLESTEVVQYGPIAGDDENARELRGSMAVDGEGGYPFVLRVVVDGGEPGAGEDTIELRVGAAAGTPEADEADDFAYEAAMTVVSGDLQLLTFEA